MPTSTIVPRTQPERKVVVVVVVVVVVLVVVLVVADGITPATATTTARAQ